MAVIVPGPLDQSRVAFKGVPNQRKLFPKSRKLCWTATSRTNARIVSRMKTVGSQADWTTEWDSSFLEAAQMDLQSQALRKDNVIGIKSQSPVGIITFEDIIDTILQKTSRDERDFFDRGNITPPTKKRKAGDTLAHPIRSGVKEEETLNNLNVRFLEL